jgi:PBSX family phage terminase large subunit
MTIQLEHRYRPRGGAVALFESRHSEIVVSGPAGTGKSRACLEKVHMLALLNPGMRGLLVRKTLASLTSTGLVTWREQVLPEADTARLVRFYGGSAEQPPQYQYRNKSTIMIGGMDKSTKIMSSEYDVIYVQEATELHENDWEALTTRLRNGRVSFQQLLADCNPDAPHHWLKVRADRGGTQLLESRHEDNPLLYDETGQLTTRGADYISKLDALTGVRYLRLRKGVWAAAEGLIYEDYDPAVHLIDRFPIPETWTRWWAVDFGYTNPSVIQWWAQDPDGRLYLYREIYHTKRTVDVLARQALAQVRDPDGRWTEPRPRAIVCDHDAEGRAVLERELGMSTVAATKNVTEGIQAVQARLRPAGDGRPRWFVMRDSIVERDQDLADVRKPTSTPEEVVAYIWDTAAGKPPKETPRKVDDHGMDAARYVVAEIDLAARPRIRRL